MSRAVSDATYPAAFLGILQLPPVTGRLFVECLGERNHGFADLRVGKRGEPYQNTLNIAPTQNEAIYAEHFHPARGRARLRGLRLHSVDEISRRIEARLDIGQLHGAFKIACDA